jgi:hypothetical protein
MIFISISKGTNLTGWKDQQKDDSAKCHDKMKVNMNFKISHILFAFQEIHSKFGILNKDQSTKT